MASGQRAQDTLAVSLGSARSRTYFRLPLPTHWMVEMPPVTDSRLGGADPLVSTKTRYATPRSEWQQPGLERTFGTSVL